MNIDPGYIVGGVGVIIGITGFTMKLIDRGGGKRKAIYDRIEKEREKAEKKFMPYLLCNERSKRIEEKVDSVGKDVKKLLTKNGIK